LVPAHRNPFWLASIVIHAHNIADVEATLLEWKPNFPIKLRLSVISENALGRSLPPSSNSSWCIRFTDPGGSRRKPSAD
jgi:hypothetical protein